MTRLKKIPEKMPLRADGDYDFGAWLNDKINSSGITIKQLADKSGVTYVGIWNIVNGYTWSPYDDTRNKIAKALGETIPQEVEEVSQAESSLMAEFEWSDFPPFDSDQIPDLPGVYVFYDITDRPVYVGKSKNSIRHRVGDHATRFWFKKPLVEKGAFLHVPDPILCAKIELILIRFLGKHALLNSKGVTRDFEEQ